MGAERRGPRWTAQVRLPWPRSGRRCVLEPGGDAAFRSDCNRNTLIHPARRETISPPSLVGYSARLLVLVLRPILRLQFHLLPFPFPRSPRSPRSPRPPRRPPRPPRSCRPRPRLPPTAPTTPTTPAASQPPPTSPCRSTSTSTTTATGASFRPSRTRMFPKLSSPPSLR